VLQQTINVDYQLDETKKLVDEYKPFFIAAIAASVPLFP
jgi:hypothetical protein